MVGVSVPFFFPFEVTSVLLIVAAVAAMVMTRRQLGGPGYVPGRHRVGQAPPLEPDPEPEPVA